MSPITKYKRRDLLSFCGVGAYLCSCTAVGGVSKQTNSNQEGRRVVTGINAEGKSVILTDGVVPKNARHTESKQLNINTLWVDNQVPVDIDKKSETLEGYDFTLEPTNGGFKAYFLTMEPSFEADFHQTNTIDFVFIISGKLELLLEESSTILSCGDSVVQRGTNHAWRVIGEEPCRMAAVMISAVKS
jgi:quercetin dioxygenase-like cupin family protein